jgi:hypothetical protein
MTVRVTDADRQGAARVLVPYRTRLINHEPDASLEETIALALATARAEGAAAERAYVVKMIRENATNLGLFAGGRALDLLAWILSLPSEPASERKA